MAFKKKGAPSAKSLDLAATDRWSTGSSAVDSKGQVFDKTGKVMDWPTQLSSEENTLNPTKNSVNPPQLSNKKQAFQEGVNMATLENSIQKKNAMIIVTPGIEKINNAA